MNPKTVLLVDDEKHILTALKRLLRKENYTLITATSGEEGLECFRDQEIHLVISDQRMPNMSGSDFLSKVKEISPNTVRVILSGYADVSVIVEAINLGQIYRFIGKPWDDVELKESIKQCLEHYDRFNSNTNINGESVIKKNQELIETLQDQNKNLEMLNYDLEFMVKKLNSSLEFFKQMLNSIHLPIIGITKHYRVLLSNTKAKELLPFLQSLPSNTDVTDIMPNVISEAIDDCLNGNIQNQTVSFSIDNKDLIATLSAFEYENHIRGCVLTFENCISNQTLEIKPNATPEGLKQNAILIVDDDKNILSSIVRSLRSLDCKIFTANSGEQGLEVLKTIKSCAIILSDMRMPRMDGIEFLKQSIPLAPNATRLLISGACQEEIVSTYIKEGIISRFIEKPCNPKELLDYFQSILAKYSQEKSN